MIKDIFFSFKETIKQKTTNPFFGTLVIVWVIHNWELIFTFFNFEKNETLSGKISFLKGHLAPEPFLINIGQCILISFAVLILTYAFLNLSRFIVNLFEKKITPWIYKITDSSSIVLKSNFQVLEKERDILSQKLEIERESKLKLQNEVSTLEEKIKEFIKSNDEKVSEIEQINKSANDVDTQKVEKVLKAISNKGFNDFFDTLINEINNSEYIDTSKLGEQINYFLKTGIIKLEDKFDNDYRKRKFSFTDFGNILKEEYVIKNLD